MAGGTLNQLEKEGQPPSNMKYLDAMLLCIVPSQGDLPLVETCFPVIVMKYPTKKIPTAAIEYSIEGNCAKAF
eukprot:11117440-Ditylum_brightwellii.AAC.1